MSEQYTPSFVSGDLRACRLTIYLLTIAFAAETSANDHRMQYERDAGLVAVGGHPCQLGEHVKKVLAPII